MAIWSIAKLIRDAWGDEYGAGVWGLAMEEQLSWKVVHVKKSMRSIDLQWRQPSWSWTSIQGAVSIPQRVKVERCYTIKGHNNEPIFFKTKEPHRPVLDREHSDSVKEDLELGWKAWEKKTRKPSVPEPKRDNVGERSHSMPVGQKAVVTDLMTKSKPETTVSIDPRDLEPELESKSIAIKASIGTGTLHHSTIAGTYTFQLASDTNIILTAYPDDQPSPLNLSPNPLHFTILTATEDKPRPTGLGLYSYSAYDSDNEPDLPITYSGVGLLLIPATTYSMQHLDFNIEIGLAEMKLAKMTEEYWIEEARKEVRGLKDWVGEMNVKGHWRRVGVVEFEGLSEEDYEQVMSGEVEKRWLD